MIYERLRIYLHTWWEETTIVLVIHVNMCVGEVLN